MGSDSEPIPRFRWIFDRAYFHTLDARKEVAANLRTSGIQSRSWPCIFPQTREENLVTGEFDDIATIATCFSRAWCGSRCRLGCANGRVVFHSILKRRDRIDETNCGTNKLQRAENV